MDERPGRRDGEVEFSKPTEAAADAALRFIGRIASPWTSRQDCPKNLREARARGTRASVEVFPPYDEALDGLHVEAPVFLLTFLHEARRDLALQHPRHASEAKGTFALRSPVRPNPIGLHLVRLVAIDRSARRLVVDAIDVLDGTPLLDIKPYHPGVDAPADGG